MRAAGAGSNLGDEIAQAELSPTSPARRLPPARCCPNCDGRQEGQDRARRARARREPVRRAAHEARGRGGVAAEQPGAGPVPTRGQLQPARARGARAVLGAGRPADGRARRLPGGPRQRDHHVRRDRRGQRRVRRQPHGRGAGEPGDVAAQPVRADGGGRPPVRPRHDRLPGPRRADHRAHAAARGDAAGAAADGDGGADRERGERHRREHWRRPADGEREDGRHPRRPGDLGRLRRLAAVHRHGRLDHLAPEGDRQTLPLGSGACARRAQFGALRRNFF